MKGWGSFIFAVFLIVALGHKPSADEPMKRPMLTNIALILEAYADSLTKESK